MLSDFAQVSSSSSDVFLVKEQQVDQIGFCILEGDSLEYLKDFHVTAVAQDPDTFQTHHQQKAKDGNCEEEQECGKQDSSVESEKELPSLVVGEYLREANIVVNDDDDGFKTPTSLDHKIPVAIECPPAPRKSMSHFSMKRKASASPNARRNLQFVVLPQDLESLFPLPTLSDIKKKMKKARSDDE